MGISRMLLMFTITVFMAIFVVSERNKIIETGYIVAKLQRNCDELSEKNRKLGYYVDRLKSPEVIVYKVLSLKLPLVPQEDESGMIAGRIKLKDDVRKAMKTVAHKDIFTQKVSRLECCSLHN
ncbi:Cell division protein FtsL [Candidatus Brocadiaceae bacterium B188]|nr:hypothetical protein [Candidatus Brocadia sapporoensis]MEB2307819.1 hypothetical protein [Candidatus Brocadiaceae bacterium]QQR67062.1 MAG: hypothetical protein IPI25_02140 [Candidatus Brocadia sp.]RZV58355.1 MAG: hypothetical protein EX330_06280 [Candidatus Brocadia sp. BROELEC01]TWU54075.1 Cell division protein FtsL [Candidatus Brocadiaceae bacterium B188]